MDYEIIEGCESLALDEVTRLLKQTYWANRRTPEQIEASMRHSVCYGVRRAEDGYLVGFARVITDWATTYYLCDVVIDEAFRGQGLGTALVAHITAQDAYAGLRGFLVTESAHGLYQKFGFNVVDGRFMVRPPKR